MSEPTKPDSVPSEQSIVLLPCPFCGEQAEIAQHAFNKRYSVWCHCAVEVATNQFDKAEDAAAAWNTRNTGNLAEKPDPFPRDKLLKLRETFLQKFVETNDLMFYAAIMLCNAVVWYEDNASTPMSRIMGKWPGDETDEEIEAMLKKL